MELGGGGIPHASGLSAVPTFTLSGPYPLWPRHLGIGCIDRPRRHERGPKAAVTTQSRATAIVPPKVVKKLLALEFVEMSDLWADIWPEEPVSSDTGIAPRRPSKPPVTTFCSWLEFYGHRSHLQIPGEGY